MAIDVGNITGNLRCGRLEDTAKLHFSDMSDDPKTNDVETSPILEACVEVSRAVAVPAGMPVPGVATSASSAPAQQATRSTGGSAPARHGVTRRTVVEYT